VLSSLIWICTTTNNNTKVVIIDANKPDIVLETFHISCQAHIGCIASVPGKYNLFLCLRSMKKIYYTGDPFKWVHTTLFISKSINFFLAKRFIFF